MFNKKIVFTLILTCSLFKSLSCFSFEGFYENTHDRNIDYNLGKPVFSFVHTYNGVVIGQWYYTTKLSRILLVGEHQIFQTVRSWPLINALALLGPLFDNRFQDFIEHIESSCQEELQEAIKDAILLSPCNTKAYAVDKLLDRLAKALQHEIAYIKDQIKHDSTWDKKALRSMSTSVGLTVVLMVLRYSAHQDVTDAISPKNTVKNVEFLHAIATLGLLPALYGLIKGCYKVVTTDPNARNKHIEKYENVLAFVQKLTAELQTHGCITFKLANGRTVSLKDNKLIHVK